jgi:hypothetical protein
MSSGPESSSPTRNKKQPKGFLKFVTFSLEQELFSFCRKTTQEKFVELTLFTATALTISARDIIFLNLFLRSDAFQASFADFSKKGLGDDFSHGKKN